MPPDLLARLFQQRSQVRLIRRSGRTGAVSRRMHQLFLARDVATLAFAGAMGMTAGWPLLVMNGASACTKVAILYHFRWVRSSPAAEGVRRARGLEGCRMAAESGR